MLQAHLNATENYLLEISKIPANSGHPLHKGTPREAFIKKFLANHLSEEVAVGTGEIISSDSKPNEPRNQIDIVIFKRNYPKIDLEGGINAFLVESVAATIEVKSVLDKEGLEKAIRTARAIKKLKRSVHTSFTTGYQPPSILNYVVAYDGPAKMETVLSWIPPIHQSLQIDPRPKDWPNTDRLKIPSPTIDGVFILGRGFIFFDNSPLSFSKGNQDLDGTFIKWGAADSPTNNLYFLFMLLTVSLGGISASWLDVMPYVSGKLIVESNQITYLRVNNLPT